MLMTYVMDKPTKWQDYLHLVEFAYNNRKQEALGMSPFGSLYQKKCRTLDNWDGPVNKVIVGPDMLKEMEQQMVKIRQNVNEALDR